jgi:phage regulator Rha-like protein
VSKTREFVGLRHDNLLNSIKVVFRENIKGIHMTRKVFVSSELNMRIENI